MTDELNVIRTAVILGAGNVATQLGSCLQQNGIAIKQVYNRTKTTGVVLSESLQASFIDSPDKIEDDADLCLVTVSDDAIGSVVSECRLNENTFLVHTAGAIDMSVLKGKTRNYGVLYPLQTFTKGKQVDFSQIPVFVEGNNDYALKILKILAGKISRHVYDASSDDRKYLHLAAVLSSNFSNHLMVLAEQILKSKGYKLSILQPLMEETISKAFDISPAEAQTGPAIRGNSKVIRDHLKMLDDFPHIREIYRLLSESIGAERSQLG